MLTADLVAARRSGPELRLPASDEHARALIAELAAAFLEVAAAHVGRTRDELEEAWAEIEAGVGGGGRERRLAAAVRKLVEDRCRFEDPPGVDPPELRRTLFRRAAAERRALPPGGRFDRQALVSELAAAREVSPAAVESALFADLRGAERLQALEAIAPAAVAESFDMAQAQGVLLRAVRVTVTVEARAPGTYRALFNKLKFLRLLYAIAPAPDGGGYRLIIDGPFSLFQSVTRYGLKLGLALPAIAACDAWRLEADVLWGRDRQPLRFRLTGGLAGAGRGARAGARKGKPGGDGDGDGAGAGAKRAAAPMPVLAPPAIADLPDEVAALARGVERLDGPWQVEPAAAILDLPGLGLCVPDLAFTHARTGEVVFLEALGFWSREAVWRRVDLVRAGLPHKILFAVSKHLRVSEAVLDDDLPGALYVYAHVMSPTEVVTRLDRLAGDGG